MESGVQCCRACNRPAAWCVAVYWVLRAPLLAVTWATTAQAAGLLCLPDRPVVGLGGSVELNAWADAEGASFQWSVEGGVLAEGSTAKAYWTLRQAVPGQRYIARVTMARPGQDPVSCELGVTASLPELELKGSEVRQDRRMFLHGNTVAGLDGFGLYSYFLVPKPPVRGSDAERRILAALAELLRFPDVNELMARAQVQRLRSLHVVQLLLKIPEDPALHEALSRREWAAASVWVLDHYDFDRSRELAEQVRDFGRLTEGPYYVSLGKPHRFGEEVARPYLFQDHSQATERLAVLWIDGFLNQAWQADYWEPRALPQLLIRTRTLLEVAARVTGALRSLGTNGAERWVGISR